MQKTSPGRFVDEATIQKIIPQIEGELQQYCWIQDNFHLCDVSTSREFQKKYTYFYKVIRRSKPWYRHYYGLMETSKQSGATFEGVLTQLNLLTGNLEASFASKLVATIDPAKPIIDKFVLQYFDLRIPPAGTKNRIPRAVAVYDDLTARYNEIMASPIAKSIYAAFSKHYPWAQISDIKKIDFVLWQMRG